MNARGGLRGIARAGHTLLLTQTDLERLLDMKTAIRVIAEAFRQEARGHTTMPPKVYLPLPHGGDFRAMPAAFVRPPVCGIKWVNVHPGNSAAHLPTVMGTVIVNDARTGFPLAVLDGLSLTRLRTGAAAGVAARALARSDAGRVGVVGCGAQALCQVRALAEVLRLRHVKVWGPRHGEARRFCAQAQRRLRITVEPASTVKECVQDTDVVVTITPSRRPLVRRAWVAPGTHINAIGADAPGKQELDPQILRHARLIVDERRQAVHGGEINRAISRGLLTPRAIRGTLGDVLLGRVGGRTHPEEITVFDSTGIAVHDVALGYAAYRRALAQGRGRRVRFFRY